MENPTHDLWKFHARLASCGVFPAEANLQAEFYHQARMMQLFCVLELTTSMGRIDCAVLNLECDSIIAIVEFKRGKIDLKSEQIRRYKNLSVNVYGLNKWDDCRNLVVDLYNLRRNGALRQLPLAHVLLPVDGISPRIKPKTQSKANPGWGITFGKDEHGRLVAQRNAY